MTAGLGEALTGLGRASIAVAARAVLHAGGHRAPVTLPPAIPPELRRKGER